MMKKSSVQVTLSYLMVGTEASDCKAQKHRLPLVSAENFRAQSRGKVGF